ncbi:hypothetical protein E1267_39835 [Nonomuraea longispora]|uniref:Uncharacterized protein n=1 Tax=Nonomuraea longispora TaxID=1848320 RepID=A0A4R4MSM3_9ACTN|nr:hypothetical protein [Nonomuraea longispora]TDB97422.1 hypothetical protein E1267_39835 [Nonomuraea longispora]
MAREGVSEAVLSALADLERAFDAALMAIDADTDHNQAYNGATELVETLRRLFETSGNQRALAAARIFEQEKMSLADLADRIGVSKARAAQLVKTAKDTRARNERDERITLGLTKVAISAAHASRLAAKQADNSDAQDETQ